MSRSSPRPPRRPDRKLLDQLRLELDELLGGSDDDDPLIVDILEELHLAFGKRLPGALAWLGLHDDDARVRGGAMGLIMAVALDPAVRDDARRGFLAGTLPHLLALLRDPTVPDERKVGLLPLVERAGVSSDELRGCFRDLDGAAAQAAQESAKQVEDTPASVERLLTNAGLVSHESAPEVTAEAVRLGLGAGLQIAGHNGPVGVGLLVAAAAIAQEHGLATQEVADALATAPEAGDEAVSRAAYYLEELGRWTGPLAGTAQVAAAALRSRGVRPSVPGVGTFSHAIAVGVDGMGSRGLSILTRTGDGALHALQLILNDEVGIKDAFAVWEEGARVEEGIRAQDLPQTSCDLAFARRLVADALHVHARTGRPVPGRFLLYRAFLGDEPLVAAPHAPDLRPYLTETIVRGPSIAEGSEVLLEHGLYDQLWCASAEAFDFVRRLKRRSAGPKARHGVVDEFIATVAVKEKDLLVRRLAMNLEIEALGGRAKLAVNRAAARTWVALTEDVVPFARIPYVRALAGCSLDSIRASLRDGFTNQQQVNDSVFERELLERELFEQVEGWGST